MSISISKLLEAKGDQVFSASPETLALDAMKLMAAKGIGTILVVEDADLVGIVSERDFIRKLVLENRAAGEYMIKDIMTPHPITVTPEQTVEACMHLMTEKRIRHLPVVADNKVVGIISIGDVVKYLLSEKETLIKHYERYIYEGW
ncbi:MAG TPA: CBS domain-containing protein [bacterium]|nr:CBS domain-containing protein [bacterium]HPQ65757.1 CBS domain-containing protein [bacterium]